MTASLESVRAARRAASSVSIQRAVMPLTVGAGTFWSAYDGGTFSAAAYASAAIVVWWAIGVLLVSGVAAVQTVPPPARVAVCGLATLAAFTLASAAWSSSAMAVPEFDRTALYLGVLVLTLMVSRSAGVEAWVSGLGFGIGAIAVAALASRLFPGIFPMRGLPTFLPATVARLSFPLDYWNGLGIFVALGVPMLVRLTVDVRRHAAVRLVAACAVPVITSVIYLTSSRGAVASVLIASLVLLMLGRTWALFVSLFVSACGTVICVAVLNARPHLVNGPITSAAAAAEGRSAAFWLALVCAVCAACSIGLQRVLARRMRPPRWVALVAWACAVVVAATMLTISDPSHRLSVFTAPPVPANIDQSDFVRAHLLSGNGSGRWQFWVAAAAQFRSAPLVGGGAGSYAAWWAQHASFSYFVRDAHSLYLETLGEMGIVGFLALLTPISCAVVCGVRRSLVQQVEHRLAVAAVAGAFGAYLFGAAIDWLWELPAVTLVGVVCIGLLCGQATSLCRTSPDRAHTRRGGCGFAIGAIAAASVLFVLCAEASLMLGDSTVRRSQEAVRRGDLASALAQAHAATAVAPWSADGYLQIALVREKESAPGAGLLALDAAISRDSRDWRLWLVRSRLEIETGEFAAAKSSLDQARRLNPLSPLFQRDKR